MTEALLPWLSAVLVVALVARWSLLTRKTEPGRFTDLIAAALIVLAWHPSVWVRLSQGYPGDSFFTLTMPGRTGLVVLTGLMMVLFYSLSERKSRWLQKWHGKSSVGKSIIPALDVLLILLALVTALTVVPQFYYSYYLILFDGLPQQWVIKPLSIASVWHSLSVPREGNMALHSTGLYSWLLIIVAILSWLRYSNATCSGLWLIGIAMFANLAWHQIV